MADPNAVLADDETLWIRHAEEAEPLSEAEEIAVPRVAFEYNFVNVDTSQYLVNDPIGPFDSDKCTVTGVHGGYAGSPTSFVLTVRDCYWRNIPNCGGQIVVMVVPGVGVCSPDIYGDVTDLGDGTYSVSYVVPESGNYMVNVECNGFPIMGSPFSVFFSAGSANGGLLDVAPTTSYPNLVDGHMPNMPVSGSFPGLGGMIPELVPAQQVRSQPDSTGASEKDEAEMLKRTVQVSNLVPNITVDHLKELFGVPGTVVECTIITDSDSEHFAYIEYSKPEEATTALALNRFVVGDRSLIVEMAKSLSPKPTTPSPEPLKLKSRSIVRSPVHQSRNRRSKSPIRSRRRSRSLSPRHSQHNRSRSSALHRNYSSYDRRSYSNVSDRSRRPYSYGSRGYYGSASRRHTGRSPSPRGRESYRDHSHSPKYRHPLSPKARQSQHHTSRSAALHRHYPSYDRRSYRDVSDRSGRPDSSYGSRGYYGSRDYYGSASRRHTGRSPSPRGRESYRDRSHSPKYRYRSSKHLSKSPDHHLGGRSSHTKAETRKRNRSKSADRETNPRVSHAKRKSVDGRRARSKSVEGGLKDESREEKHRRRSMNRSRSVSAEPNSHSGGKSS